MANATYRCWFSDDDIEDGDDFAAYASEKEYNAKDIAELYIEENEERCGFWSDGDVHTVFVRCPDGEVLTVDVTVEMTPKFRAKVRKA